MLHQLGGEAQLIESVQSRHVASGTGAEPGVVIIVVIRPPPERAAAGGLLVVDVHQAVEPEGAIVEPIVPPPTVHHGIDRHRGAQRGMGMHECHQRGEAIIGNAQDADLAVALRHVLHQPVDGVIGVGGVIDRRGVERAVQRPGHHVIAFGTMFATHILDDPDVAAVDHGVIRHVSAVDHSREMRAGILRPALAGAVRCAAQQHRRALRAAGNEDDGV